MKNVTKALSISPKVKRVVIDRDAGVCIICGRPGLPECHYIARAQLGLGIEQNIVTTCRECHDLYDKTEQRERIKNKIRAHLERHYPGFPDEDRIYVKYRF